MGKIIVADLQKRSKKGIEYGRKILKAESICEPKLREALDYYLENWGDFVHPGLFAAACEASGGNPDSVVPAQAAVAIMAAAFDIQDDIIDKSKEKHNKPTVYGKYGAEIAILLGNAFLIEGFKLFVDSASQLPKENCNKALEKLKSLLFELGNAHGLELGFKNSTNGSPADYMKIIEMKAAGIEADLCLGAIFGEANDSEVKNLARIGRILGILITLREDFIDIFEFEELRQRIAAYDLPLPLIAIIRSEAPTKDLLEILQKRRISKADANKILAIALDSKPAAEIKKRMQLLIREGTNLSNKLPNVELQGNLRALLSFMLEDL